MNLLSIYQSTRSEDNYNKEFDSDQIKILSKDNVQCNDKSEKSKNSKLLNLLLIFLS